MAGPTNPQLATPSADSPLATGPAKGHSHTACASLFARACTQCFPVFPTGSRERPHSPSSAGLSSVERGDVQPEDEHAFVHAERLFYGVLVARAFHSPRRAGRANNLARTTARLLTRSGTNSSISFRQCRLVDGETASSRSSNRRACASFSWFPGQPRNRSYVVRQVRANPSVVRWMDKDKASNVGRSGVPVHNRMKRNQHRWRSEETEPLQAEEARTRERVRVEAILRRTYAKTGDCSRTRVTERLA